MVVRLVALERGQLRCDVISSSNFEVPTQQKAPPSDSLNHERKHDLVSWKQKVYSCLKLHNYHKEDFSVQGVVWLESNTKHL